MSVKPAHLAAVLQLTESAGLTLLDDLTLDLDAGVSPVGEASAEVTDDVSGKNTHHSVYLSLHVIGHTGSGWCVYPVLHNAITTVTQPLQ